MNLTIKSKTEIETICGAEKPVFDFYAPVGGGYVHLDGPYGRQICYGGRFTGNTIVATPENFVRVCRSWYRAYMRSAK